MVPSKYGRKRKSMSYAESRSDESFEEQSSSEGEEIVSDQLRCHLCQKAVLNARRLATHLRIRHRSEPELNQSKNERSQAEFASNIDKTAEMPKCQLEETLSELSTRKRRRSQDMNDQSGTKVESACQLCDRVFSSGKGLRRHVLIMHRKQPLKSDQDESQTCMTSDQGIDAIEKEKKLATAPEPKYDTEGENSSGKVKLDSIDNIDALEEEENIPLIAVRKRSRKQKIALSKGQDLFEENIEPRPSESSVCQSGQIESKFTQHSSSSDKKIEDDKNNFQSAKEAHKESFMPAQVIEDAAREVDQSESIKDDAISEVPISPKIHQDKIHLTQEKYICQYCDLDLENAENLTKHHEWHLSESQQNIAKVDNATGAQVPKRKHDELDDDQLPSPKQLKADDESSQLEDDNALQMIDSIISDITVTPRSSTSQLDSSLDQTLTTCSTSFADTTLDVSKTTIGSEETAEEEEDLSLFMDDDEPEVFNENVETIDNLYCKLCSFKAETDQAFRAHLSTYEHKNLSKLTCKGAKTVQCTLCDFTSFHPDVVRVHKRSHKKTPADSAKASSKEYGAVQIVSKAHYCAYCQYMTKDLLLMVKHNKLHHS